MTVTVSLRPGHSGLIQPTTWITESNILTQVIIASRPRRVGVEDRERVLEPLIGQGQHRFIKTTTATSLPATGLRAASRTSTLTTVSAPAQAPYRAEVAATINLRSIGGIENSTLPWRRRDASATLVRFARIINACRCSARSHCK